MARSDKKTLLLQVPVRMYNVLQTWMRDHRCENTFISHFLSWFVQQHRKPNAPPPILLPPAHSFDTRTLPIDLDILSLLKLEKLALQIAQPRHVVLFITLCEYLDKREIFSYDDYVFSREQYGLISKSTETAGSDE